MWDCHILVIEGQW